MWVLVTMVMYKCVANNRDQFKKDFTDILIQYLDCITSKRVSNNGNQSRFRQKYIELLIP